MLRRIFAGADTYTSPTGNSYKLYIEREAEAGDFSQYVSLWGRVTEEELISYYFGCDIFVAPSRYESFGLVYIEAMACSKPAVGSNIGGIPEVIKDGQNGLLFPLDDHMKLAHTIISLLEDYKKAIKLGENARSEVENNFTDIIIANRTLEVMTSVL